MPNEKLLEPLEVDFTNADAIIILADIHGNWQALDAVLKDVKAKQDANGWDAVKYLSLGDVVGYGPDPVKCLETVRGLTEKTGVNLMGNHEDYVNELVKRIVKGTMIDPRNVGILEKAVKGIYWTIQQIYGDKTRISEDLIVAKEHVVHLIGAAKSTLKELLKKLPIPSQAQDGGLEQLFLGSGSDPNINIYQNALASVTIRKQLDDAQIKKGNALVEYIKKLPIEAILKTTGGDIYATHANINDPISFRYTFMPNHPERKRKGKRIKEKTKIEYACENWPEWLKQREVKIRDAFVGHAHYMGWYQKNDRYKCSILSVGSVGDSRHNDELVAEYAILRPKKNGIKLNMIKVSYDYCKFETRLEKAGLLNPAELRELD